MVSTYVYMYIYGGLPTPGWKYLENLGVELEEEEFGNGENVSVI